MKTNSTGATAEPIPVPRSWPAKLWSAMPWHRFWRSADLSAEQCRVERHVEVRAPFAPPPGPRKAIGPARAFDGDKSPAESGVKPPHSEAWASLRLGVIALVLLPFCLGAATNDLTSTLQRGLFEEEANQNLEAAAQAYQAVSAQFDKDRKLAATAIFRLGEVYRKQNKTNEAVAQYERIVREFSDQTTLATLSRQNIAGLGVGTKSTGPSATEPEAVARTAAAQMVQSLTAELTRLKAMSSADARTTVQQNYPNPVLTELMKQLATAEQRLATQRQEYTTEHPLVKATTAQLETIAHQIEEQVEGAIKALEFRLESAQAVLAQAGAGATGNPLSPAARLEQKRLLEEEIKLVEQDLAELRKQHAAGLVSQTELRAKEREVLQLRQQVAALDMGAAPQTAHAPVTDEEEAEIRRIQAMIQNSPDLIEAKDSARGATPLHSAAGLGQLRVAEFLLTSGADVEAKDRMWNGATPMHYAADGGHKGMIELLLGRKANVNAMTVNGETPLHLAARKGFKSIVELLLASGANVNAKLDGRATPLHMAAVNGFKNVAETLLKAKADPDVVTTHPIAPITGGGSYRGAPIHIAINRGDRALWELLLSHGADLNLKDSSGRTPLREAVENDAIAAVETLLARKADVNISDRDGTSPLLVAVNREKVEVVRLLLEHRADPEAAGKVSHRPPGFGSDFYGGSYPLHLAVEKGNLEILKLLLDRGVNVNSEPSRSGTVFAPPIWSALSLEKTNVLKLLLQFKADPNVTNANGQTPLIQAINPVRKETVGLLLEAGADVKLADKNGWTALHLAAYYGQRDLAALILNKGADPNALNNDRQTPLDLAKSQRGQRPPPSTPGSTTAPVQREEIIALLKQHGALDELPFFDRIEVRRPGSGFSAVAFSISTNGWNGFSLLELLAQHYGFLSTDRNAVWEVNKSTVPSSFWSQAACQFPDFARVAIRRPDRSGPRWTEIPVSAAALLESGDCARDVKLQPGDIVEIPEADHPVNEKWAGLPQLQLSNLLHCVSRTVTISIKGTPTKLKHSPELTYKQNVSVDGRSYHSGHFLTKGSFMLKSVLAQSRLLRASSDVSRVRVTRQVDGKTQEWVLDCGAGSDPDLWLRDGDVIEVPDKP